MTGTQWAAPLAFCPFIHPLDIPTRVASIVMREANIAMSKRWHWYCHGSLGGTCLRFVRGHSMPKRKHPQQQPFLQIVFTHYLSSTWVGVDIHAKASFCVGTLLIRGLIIGGFVSFPRRGSVIHWQVGRLLACSPWTRFRFNDFFRAKGKSWRL